jgi:predicted permease
MWSRVVALLSRLRFALARQRVDDEARAEFESHLELLTDRYVRLGMRPDEARRAASRQFGNALLVREELRQMNGIGWLEELAVDVRYGLRLLHRNRGYAVVAILTLALGVGANAAVFSVVSATLIQPLPYADPERLVAVFETARRVEVERRAVSYPNFRDWQRESRSFETMSAVLGGRFTLAIDDSPERVFGELVSGHYFDLLGVRPLRGRGLTPRDDAPGAAPVVVISDALWRRAFGSDPQIVGRRLTVDGELCTVVGVMPPGFSGIVDASVVWAPIARFAATEIVSDRGQRSIDLVVARLAPGVSIEQAGTEIDALATRIDRMYPSAVGARGAGVAPLHDEFFGGLRQMLLVLLGAVGFVLIIACVNVASLMLARGTARHSELAVRCALGARRGRIVRQLLTESVVLFVLGGAAGLLAAFWSVDLLVAMSPVPFPEFVSIDVDSSVFAFTLTACLAGGLLFGVVPAVAASRVMSLAKVKTMGRDGSSAMVRRGLVTAEIALALVLLVGAGLMLRTLDRLTTFDPGFRPRGLVTLRLTVPETSVSGEAAPERLAAFSRTLLEQIRGLPGVSAASLSSDVPLGTSTSATNVRIEGDDKTIRVYRHAVSPGHFQTIGAPLLKGRDFTDADGRMADRVVIVSRAMANRHWPAGDALHKRIWRGDQVFEIVGIVGDLQHRRLLEPDSADPDIYLHLYQAPPIAFATLARTAADVQPIVTAIRQTIAQLDPAVPVFQIETGEQLVGRQTAPARFSGVLLAAFALVALTLTMVGIYGVTAEIVSRQTRQFGIRMALGATPADVLRLVLSRGIAFITTGLVLGTVAALSLTRLLASWIYGVSATDPATFAAVIVVLALVAILACLIPAAKATRIDLLVALRSE